MKTKLLFILPSATIGGAEIQALYLLNNLNYEKFEAYCGFLYENSQLEKEFSNKIKIIKLNKKSEWDLSIYFRISDFIKRNNINVIQTFLGNHHAYLPVIFNKKVKCILGIRATSERKSILLNLTKYFLPKLILKYRDLIFVSNSKKGKEIYIKNGIPEKNIIIINNGINVKKFSKGNKKKIVQEFNLNNKFVIGMIARLAELKNQQLLIKITNNLKSLFPNLKVIIVGDGPNKENLEKLIKNLNLEDYVILTGARRDIPDLLSAMDIFAFPSLFPEGWPNVIGEAMASGVPVIAYDKGDIKEIITNGYDGIITECNEKIFEEQLIKLIKDKKLQKKLSVNAKKTIKKYDIKEMVYKYEKLYT